MIHLPGDATATIRSSCYLELLLLTSWASQSTALRDPAAVRASGTDRDHTLCTLTTVCVVVNMPVNIHTLLIFTLASCSPAFSPIDSRWPYRKLNSLKKLVATSGGQLHKQVLPCQYMLPVVEAPSQAHCCGDAYTLLKLPYTPSCCRLLALLVLWTYSLSLEQVALLHVLGSCRTVVRVWLLTQSHR